jgi:hypothetical protein
MTTECDAIAGSIGKAAAPGVKPRPAVFRALGHAEPPAAIEIDGERFRRIEVLKHDSWAASGIYASTTGKAFCKFNRQQRVGCVPLAWLGRLLAAREHGFHDRLHDVEGIPAALGPVRVEGRALPHAVARRFIAGHALREGEWVSDDFFPQLRRLLAEMHARGVAHVDLHKRENILVDDDGRPHLIDFQISFSLPRRDCLATRLFGWLLTLLQRSDDYHLLKHELKHRPDQARRRGADMDRDRPWWISAHRMVAVPFRAVRRGLLVWLGIRSAGGQAHTEAFPEIAHRRAA